MQRLAVVYWEAAASASLASRLIHQIRARPAIGSIFRSYNALLDEFFHQVEAGRWSARDPRSVTDKIL